MLRVITDLNEEGIEETIVLGFDIYLESAKTIKNSDLLVAITSQDSADANFSKTSKVQFTNDPDAQRVNLSDQEFMKQYPLSYKELCLGCKNTIFGFKQGKKFHGIVSEIKKDPQFAYKRKLNPNNLKSVETIFYADCVINVIAHRYS